MANPAPLKHGQPRPPAAPPTPQFNTELSVETPRGAGLLTVPNSISGLTNWWGCWGMACTIAV